MASRWVANFLPCNLPTFRLPHRLSVGTPASRSACSWTNFLPTRNFRDPADLNAQARAWVKREAGTRVHGATREQPLVLFAAARPVLRRLPPAAPDLGPWHRVVLHRDSHVQFEKSL